MNKINVRIICLLVMTCLIGWCASPFGVNATLTAAGEKTWNLSLIFKVPPEHHLYEADLKVEADGLELEQVAMALNWNRLRVTRLSNWTATWSSRRTSGGNTV